MNQTLRPQPLMSEVLPGALTLGLVLFMLAIRNPFLLDHALAWDGARIATAAGAFLLGAWIVGTFLDSIRNLIEHVADCAGGSPLNWDFFFYGNRDKVAQLDEHYFAYYTAKANYVIGLVVALLYFGLLWCLNPSWVTIAIFSGVTVALICLLDAILLRREIKHLVREPSSVAHFGVYTRLKPSSTFPGVGVFAIQDIPKGTNIFSGDTTETREIDKKDVGAGCPSSQKTILRLLCVQGRKNNWPDKFQQSVGRLVLEPLAAAQCSLWCWIRFFCSARHQGRGGIDRRLFNVRRSSGTR